MRGVRERFEDLSRERGPRRPTWGPGARWVFAAFGVAALVLIALSGPRRVGDGGEYMVQALRMSALESPSVSREEAAEVREELRRLGAGYENILPHALHDHWRGDGGRYDMPHLWLYPALAVPGIWAARVVGIHPQYGFVLLNLALLLAALWIALPRMGMMPSLLIFGSPLLWWLDKVHTEVFTFSLLAGALLLLRERPWWSLVALGILSAQNPVFLVVLPLAAGLIVLDDRTRLRDRRLWIGGATGGALALLHPVYFVLRLGRPFPQSDWGAEPHIPSLAETGSLFWDTNIGAIVHFPLLVPALLFVLAVLLVQRPREALRPGMALGGTGAVAVLVVVAQTVNHNHGGTPSMSRYVIWILPFAIPLLAAAKPELRGHVMVAFALLAVGSVFISLVTYNPARPSRYMEPTAAATYVWTHRPGLENPLAEIFYERTTPGPVDQAEIAPASTAGCEKVLLVGGSWPEGCVQDAGQLPDRCLETNAFCYANRVGDDYDVVTAPN